MLTGLAAGFRSCLTLLQSTRTPHVPLQAEGWGADAAWPLDGSQVLGGCQVEGGAASSKRPLCPSISYIHFSQVQQLSCLCSAANADAACCYMLQYNASVGHTEGALAVQDDATMCSHMCSWDLSCGHACKKRCGQCLKKTLEMKGLAPAGTLSLLASL